MISKSIKIEVLKEQLEITNTILVNVKRTLKTSDPDIVWHHTKGVMQGVSIIINNLENRIKELES